MGSRRERRSLRDRPPSRPWGRRRGISLSDPLLEICETRVARIGLGTMSLTGRGVWGEPRDPAEARRVLRRAADSGVGFFDTADSYGPAVAEQLVADALHPYEGIVVATKGGLTRSGPGRWARDCRPEHLRSACEASLGRLRVDRIDLYQLHTVDPDVPVEDSAGALEELRREGKIGAIGLCNVDATVLDRARAIAPIASVQNRYSLADHSSHALVERCAKLGIVFIAWAPLAKGSLASSRTLRRVADAHGATPAQVALRWILASSPAALAIPGTSSVAHLEENLGAAAVQLTDEQIALLATSTFEMPAKGKRTARLRRLARRFTR